MPARRRSRLGIVSERFARHALLLLCAAGITTAPVHAQSCAVPGASGNASVSGIVNTYYVPAAGTYAGASSIAISGARGSATAFAAGDLALVIQMQCANINAVNTAAYGGSGTNGNGYTDPASGCLAGLYEYAPVASFTAGTLSFSAGLQNTYIQDATTATNRRTFQVVRVPQYSSATLSGGVTASYWDGTTGGLVAMDVAGQLAWGGQTIDVAGRGFRGGGGIDQSGFNLSGTTIPPYLSNNTTPQHAPKGEGIAGTPRQVWDPQTAATVDLGGTWGGLRTATTVVAHPATRVAAVPTTTVREITAVAVVVVTAERAATADWVGAVPAGPMRLLQPLAIRMFRSTIPPCTTLLVGERSHLAEQVLRG